MPTVPEVSIHIRADYPLNRQLDASAGELVLRKIEGMGVKVHTKSTIKGVRQSDGVFTGMETATDPIDSDMIIFAVGIKPRDDLARASGIEVDPKGGIKVADDLSSSAKDVYAIGECASWNGNVSCLIHGVRVKKLTPQFYGLIAPGIEMADILAFNLTQTDGHAPRKMNTPDLSTRLKLMGVDVANFGDHFADMQPAATVPAKTTAAKDGEVSVSEKPSKRSEPAVKCLTYHDPFSATYKKYIFNAAGTHLLGGLMVGDVGDFTKLVAITKKKVSQSHAPCEYPVLHADPRRKSWTFPPRPSSWAPNLMRSTGTISTTMQLCARVT